MSTRVAVFALAILAGGSPAFAESGQDKEAKLVAAIEACDKGAAAPLDPGATAPPIQFTELFGPDYNLDALRGVADACKTATLAKPDDKHLKLQWLRSEIALSERFGPSMTEQVRRLADAGSAEANFLLFVIHRNFSGGGVGLPEAQASLTTAAEAGHREALQTVIDEYRFGSHFKRDPHQAVHFATILADLPSQGIGSPSAADIEAQKNAPLVASGLVLMSDAFSPDEQSHAFTIVRGLYEDGGEGAFIPYVTALRYGRGTGQDAAKARQLLEDAVANKNARALVGLADMLANGEGGPADGKRAIDLLTSPLAHDVAYYSGPALAALYLDNRFTGRRPREALRLLAASNDIDARVRAAGLFVDYDEKLQYPDSYRDTMDAAAEVGEPGAAMAWARLKLSGHPQFGNDVSGARDLLARLADGGDSEAAVMLAETQYVDLDEAKFNPPRRDGGMSDDEIRTLLDAATRSGQASAWRVKAEYQRVGVIYPQDDATATKSLIEAAGGGDVPAMVLLGKAYSDGLGVPENSRERLRWWREAARLGSLEATEDLTDAFPFDSFDKLMNLREGVSQKIALYNNGPDPEAIFGGMDLAMLSGTFSGGRASDAGNAALAEAVMDGFRIAPAGLDEKKLLPLVRALPDEIKVEIEKALKEQGFYAGSPDGYFGPEVRDALAAWVEARGPIPDEVSGEGAESPPAAAGPSYELPTDLVDRVRDRVFTEANRGDLTDEEKQTVVGELNTLAQYGDLASRWALLRNYHQSGLVRSVVDAGDMTRYGLDLLVTRPEQAEKVEFEFIFTVSAMYEGGVIDAFGEALVDAVRDDQRLQDSLTLGGVLQQVVFAPGACDAVLAAAAKKNIADAGDDGCAEPAQVAVIAYAKEAGPAGVEAAIRAAAADKLKAMDVAAK